MDREETRRPKQTLIMERALPHSPEFVWQALIDPTALEQWLLPNTFQPRLGYRFRFLNRSKNGVPQKVHCQVIEMEAPHRLAYTWRVEDEEIPTLVTWTLEPIEEGTCLHLEHIGPEISGQFANNLEALSDRLVPFLRGDAVRTQTGAGVRSACSLGRAVATGPTPIGRIVLKPRAQILRHDRTCVHPHRTARPKEDLPCIR